MSTSSRKGLSMSGRMSTWLDFSAALIAATDARTLRLSRSAPFFA